VAEKVVKMLDQFLNLVQDTLAMHGIAAVGRMGKLVEVIPDTGKLMTYPT
jgi:formate dehydrogenase assembly factor FdhD